MTYLICEKCGGYYELQEGEKVEDFSDECECGGKLHYTDSIPDLDYSIDSENTLSSSSTPAMDPNPDLDIDPTSVTIENQYTNLHDGDRELHETLTDSIETIDLGNSLNESKLNKSELKEFKLAVELQEILDVKGNYIIHGADGESIKLLKEEIEIDSGQFLEYLNIISIQDRYNPKSPKKSGITGLISSGYSLISSRNWSFKIIFNKGEFELKGVKKIDAQRLVSFLNRLIKHRIK